MLEISLFSNLSTISLATFAKMTFFNNPCIQIIIPILTSLRLNLNFLRFGAKSLYLINGPANNWENNLNIIIN